MFRIAAHAAGGLLLALLFAPQLDAQPFVHPGCLSTSNDLARMRAKVMASAQPWKASWDRLIANSHAQLSYNPNPQATICRGGSCGSMGLPENYIVMARDAAAAYQCALRYHGSGNAAYADKAVQIMDAWANTLTRITGSTDALLALGGQGYQWACAAELMRDYPPWVGSGGFTNFQNWLLTEFYPECRRFLLGTGSSSSDHNGTCDSHYWANWDLFAMCAMISIGVVCDRADIYDEAVDYFRTGVGNGAADKVVFFTHPGYLGQWQEAGRDQGHSIFGPILLGVFCEIAWNQGDDLYSHASSVLLAGSEYVTKYNLGDSVPYATYANCDNIVQTRVSSSGRGASRPGWDLIYNHYVHRIGTSAPFTEAMAARVRPEGGGGNYGNNSGGYDQLGFTTLTHTLDPIATNAVPAPSGLWPDVRNSTVILSWQGSAYATSYNVRRATNVAGPYSTIASVPAPAQCHTNLGLLKGTTYYYTVSAVMGDVETTNSAPASATPNRLLRGTLIGSSGSYNNLGATKETLFDNALGNWYDAANSSGDWAGLDLGRSNVITEVRYAPRINASGRMSGGRFQGANVADFNRGVATLFTVGGGTPQGILTAAAVSDPGAYRYVRYIGPDGGSCNAAEIQFFGTPLEPTVPEAVITAPADNVMAPPGTISIAAIAGAPDGDVPITRVEFHAGLASIGVSTNEPYTLNWSNAPLGRFALTARATDSLGRTGTSAPVHVVIATPATLVPSGTVWKFNDTGANLGEAWRSNNFNDTTWPAGPAMLGFGDADGLFPATLIASNRQVTTYFRQRFDVADASLALELNLRLLRDDAAVVYLNGAEVWRDPNLPEGAITSSDLALEGLGGADESTWLEAVLSPAALITGPNLIAVEVHQSSITSSDLAFDLELTTSFTGPNQPPTVALASPADGAVAFLDVTLVANASDPDGTVETVEFFSDSIKVGEVLAPPFALTVNLPAGTNAIFIIATDHAGASATSAVRRVIVGRTVPATIVPAGSTWRFRDLATDPGPTWHEPAFNDSVWGSGPAMLGFGDADGVVPATLIADNNQWTAYLRHAFFVPDAGRVHALEARIQRDDGAVVYLNGVDVWRENMPGTDPITYNTPASSTVGGADESAWFTRALDPLLLQSGSNVVAVEVHQIDTSSSDIAFDFELIGMVEEASERPSPSIRVVAASTYEVRWAATIGNDWGLYQTARLTPGFPWLPVSAEVAQIDGTNVATIVNIAPTRFYRLQR